MKHPPHTNRELGLVRLREAGHLFETHRPVTFRFAHNTARSPNMGSRFGQDIEPAGFYCLHVPKDAPLPGWQIGQALLQAPIVLALTLDAEIYGPLGWKARLSRAFQNRKGRALSKAILREGYDGIVTVHHGETSEIVLLARTR